jgi:crossover junction endodeoxyribonuclease RuvC
MRVLGIDCGSKHTGYGIIDSDGISCELVTCGVIRASPQAPLAERLLKICGELERLVSDYAPQVAAIEDVFFAVNVKSALKLGHVRGAAMLAAARGGIPVAEYSPLQVKSSVVGYGRAEKGQVQHMVKVLLRLPEPPESEDAADALAVAICHANLARAAQALARSAAAGQSQQQTPRPRRKPHLKTV